MKLSRYGQVGREKPGAFDADGRVRDLSGLIDDIGPGTLADLDRLSRLDLQKLPLVDDPGRLGPCVGNIGKFMCIGLNYTDHAAETGAPIPDEPIVFMMATTAVCGSNDHVFIPPGSMKTDWRSNSAS